MSRTPKRGKPPGFDYWGKRKLSGFCSPALKRASRRIQRAADKQSQRREQAQ